MNKDKIIFFGLGGMCLIFGVVGLLLSLITNETIICARTICLDLPVWQALYLLLIVLGVILFVINSMDAMTPKTPETIQ